MALTKVQRVIGQLPERVSIGAHFIIVIRAEGIGAGVTKVRVALVSGEGGKVGAIILGATKGNGIGRANIAVGVISATGMTGGDGRTGEHRTFIGHPGSIRPSDVRA